MSTPFALPSRARRLTAVLAAFTLVASGAFLATPAAAEEAPPAPVESSETPATTPTETDSAESGPAEPSETTAPAEEPGPEATPEPAESPAAETPAPVDAPEPVESTAPHESTAAFGALSATSTATATLTVEPAATGLDPEGATLTVKGSGYQINAGGIYAQIGWIIEGEWTPLASDNTRSANRSNAKSALVGAGFPGQPAWTMAEDGTGSFTWTVTVTEDELEAKRLAGGTMAVFTLGSHSNWVQPANERFVPISFAEPEPTAGITVTPSTDVAADDTVTVTGAFPAQFDDGGGLKDTGLYLMWCVDPEGGRATGSQCDSSKQAIVSPVALFGGMVPATGTVEDGWWTFEVEMPTAAVFGDHECLATGEEQCGVFARLMHTFTGANNRAFDQFVPVTFAEPEPTATATTLVSSAAELAAGTGLTLTATVSPASATGHVIFRDGAAVLATIPVVTGSAAHSLTPAAGAHSYTAEFVPAAASGLTGSTSTAVTVNVTPPPAPPQLSAGALSWGIKSSFISYVTGPIANGSVSVYGGAGYSGGLVHFPQGSADAFDRASGNGTVGYRGTVAFTGHHGELDLAFTDPVITVSGASGSLSVVSGGSRITLATLAIGSGSRSVDASGAITWSGVPATLTAAGATAFAGFYGAGTALDPVTFTVGAPNGSSLGVVGVVAAAAAEPTTRTPAPTPPATTGAAIVGNALPSAGGEIEVRADGFQPNETGILIVIYSQPVLLGVVNADANGVATWKGRLPAGLTGQHTLTFQGSVSRGIVLDIAEAASYRLSASACTVEDATLEWGFKESFRSYISGTIANGEWTVSDGAEYETPSFSWHGTGSLDPEAASGELSFEGAVRFTGHEGILDTTIANPVIRLDGDGTGVLLLDVQGTTRDGEPVQAQGIEYATLDFAGVEPIVEGDTLTFSGVPATLTAAGAVTLTSYPEGEAMDPVTLVISVPSDCVGSPTPEAVATDGGEEAPAAGPDLSWLWWLLGALVLAAVAVVVTVLLVRGRGIE